MIDLPTTLNQLAELNYSGAVFLVAYGLTWLACALLWRHISPKNAALVTLFQGMVALPIALGVSAALGMFDDRPGGEMITQLSMLVAMSQLLILPLLIVLHAKKNYTAIPLLFALAGAIHFVPYAWLYQTPIYVIMSVVLAVALTVVYSVDKPKTGQLMSPQAASLVCGVTGGLLLTTAIVLLAI